MRPRRIAVTMIVVLASGCSLPRPWERVQLDDIPGGKVAEIDALPELAVEKPAAPPYRDLGPVEGISCKRSSRESASWEDAVRRTKFRAMQKGANAIKDLQCEEPKGRSLTTLCYESIRCTATAVEVRK